MLDREQAIEQGATALFGEKYGASVRVVSLSDYSKELCGGTHVSATGCIGLFKIISEGGIAAGVRRIEAVVAWPAYEWARREHDMLRGLAQQFSAPVEEISERIAALMDQNKKLKKEQKKKETDSALADADSLLDQKQDIQGVAVVVAAIGEHSMDNLRAVSDVIRPKLASGVIVLGSTFKGKACFMATVTDDLIAKGLHAGKLIGQVAKIAGGGGGGQPQKAQAGAKDAGKVDEALAQATQIITTMLNA